MKKFEAIESLRGYMAWWVVLAHALHLTGARVFLPTPLAHWVTQPDIAVAVFIIISGFVIAHLLLAKEEPYLAYITRRVFRLGPLYYAMIAVALLTRQFYTLAYTVNPFTSGQTERVARIAEENSNSVVHGLLHLVGLHGAVPDTIVSYASTTILSPAWSISLEWQFYILAPFIVGGIAARRRIPATPAVLLSASILLAVSGRWTDWRYPSFLPLALFYFAVGIASRLLLERLHVVRALAFTALSAVPLLVAQHSKNDILGMIIALGIWVLFIAITKLEIAEGRRPKFLMHAAWLIAWNPLARAIGKVSYSTYLSHIPVLSIAIGLTMLRSSPMSQADGIAAAALGALCVIPISFALHRYIEVPFNKLGGRLARAFGDNPKQATSQID